MITKKSIIILFVLLSVCITFCAAAELKTGTLKVLEKNKDVSARNVNNCVELPKPVISFINSEVFTTNEGDTATRYWFSIDNWADYSSSLFTSAPDLPPCGLNTNSSRTWVSIYDQKDTYIYGYCSLGAPDHLKKLWFAPEKGKIVPDLFYVTIQDRRCNQTSRSNSVILPVSTKKDESVVSINTDLLTSNFTKEEESSGSDENIALISVDKDVISAGIEEPGESDLPAPIQVSPEKGAKINNPQRSLTCTWNPVEGAASYTLQVDCFHCCEDNKWCTDIGEEYRLIEGITKTTETTLIGGMNDGRWRVWAVDSDGKSGTKSVWRMFTCEI